VMTGQCNCGSVRFKILAEPSGVYVCHCSICRRSTGSNGIAVILVRNEDFEWIEGADKIAKWTKPKSDWETWFCTTCGARVPGQNDASRMFVPAGLLNEDGSSLRVIHHIWVCSKASWDVIGDQGKQHECEYRG
jgi:hypothetical protein